MDLHDAPAALSHEIKPRYQLNGRLGSPRTGLDDLEKRDYVVPVGIRTPDRAARSRVSVPATLSRLTR